MSALARAALFIAPLSLFLLAATLLAPNPPLAAAGQPAAPLTPPAAALRIWATGDLTYGAGWRVADHPRLTGDFNRDGRTDLVGFGDDDVLVALSTGSNFAVSSWSDDTFTNEPGWHPTVAPRLVGDFDGDRRTDVIGFANGVHVGESTGSTFDFVVWTYDELDYVHGWEVDKHPRLVGNFDGDERDDVAGFGNQNVWVGLSTGGAANLDIWTSYQFTYNTGWRVDKHPRLVGDFDGNGSDDVAGIGGQNIWLLLSLNETAYLPFVANPPTP